MQWKRDMGSKSQRRKERHTKKRQEKRKKQQTQERSRESGYHRGALPPLGSHERHRQRLAQQRPQAWTGETPEDAAVFDDSVLSTLPAELAQQVLLVRESLQAAAQSHREEAFKSLSVISRSSPLSEWRLFIRGLVDWLANQTEAAGETWKRLDPERRPGRIATAMMLSLRSDLEQVSRSPQQVNSAPPASESSWERWDDQLLYHAKLLRRVRFDRAALQIAEAGLKMPEESSKLILGPRKLEWLKQFVREYGETEPELATALSQTAVARAFAQDYSDLFDTAVKSFPGPRHDRRNLVLTFLYFSRYENDRAAENKAEKALDDYLNRDLPANETLSESLRGAIASQIHLFEATAMITARDLGGMMNLYLPAQEDSQAIRQHLKKSLKAFPSNLPAYKTYVGWLQSKLDDDHMTRARRETLEKELAGVMQKWSSGRPDDVEPRLWLVDFLLENEQMSEARPHVDFLAAARQDDPRVRATPWKWQLLEAMRLCRRKAWLADVPARLDEAETLWPVWMSREWLPYLRAAWMLRSGQTEAFEAERRRICEVSGFVRDSLADACMMLGAAQRMRVPAAVLKQLRAPIESALKNPDKISLEDYVDAAGFFWDLHRAQLVYPAYRMHGGKIGQTLLSLWNEVPGVVLDGINDERIHKAALWSSEYMFWSYSYDRELPACFQLPVQQRHPVFVAARVNAFVKQRYHWGSRNYQDLGLILREAAGAQRDPYYRHWFLALAEQLDDIVARETAPISRFPFGDIFDLEDEDENEDDDDSLDFGFDCPCPRCQKKRQARGR